MSLDTHAQRQKEKDGLREREGGREREAMERKGGWRAWEKKREKSGNVEVCVETSKTHHVGREGKRCREKEKEREREREREREVKRK